MNALPRKPFPEQLLIDWEKRGLNPLEEEQVSQVFGPRLSPEELRAYISDPIRCLTPVCRSVLGLFTLLGAYEATIRRLNCRPAGGNPFAAEEPFQTFPKLKAFWRNHKPSGQARLKRCGTN